MKKGIKVAIAATLVLMLAVGGELFICTMSGTGRWWCRLR